MSPDAKVVVLKQTEERVAAFYRYAARLKAKERIVAPGDMLIVYRVDKTIPDGPVIVTENTEFVFAN